MLRVKAAKIVQESRVLRLQFRVSLSDSRSELAGCSAASLELQRRAREMSATWGYLLVSKSLRTNNPGEERRRFLLSFADPSRELAVNRLAPELTQLTPDSVPTSPPRQLGLRLS
jgi:hypothetical protein